MIDESGEVRNVCICCIKSQDTPLVLIRNIINARNYYMFLLYFIEIVSLIFYSFVGDDIYALIASVVIVLIITLCTITILRFYKKPVKFLPTDEFARMFINSGVRMIKTDCLELLFFDQKMKGFNLLEDYFIVGNNERIKLGGNTNKIFKINGKGLSDCIYVNLLSCEICLSPELYERYKALKRSR